ncbi:MAG: undecaprenyl-diphosphate phosphatase [Candidatus Paceibacterota bacterium]|jgi:undecaprenyl-diphosphatase
MFDFVHAALLGIVEGVTEFLPISSTGHLIIVGRWLPLDPALSATFDIVIQLGAILAVVIVFWGKLWPISKAWGTWKKIVVAVLPALVLGALFGSKIQEALFNPAVVAVALIVGGVLLIISERMKKTETIHSVPGMTYGTALSIGLIQCLALIPGTSRSAATIIGALFLGASRTVAVEFSFFLAIPTMFAASAYSLLKGGAHLGSHDAAVLAVGFAVSFLVAWIVIRMFLKYVQHRSLVPFGYYRIIVGVLVLLFA